MVNRMNVTEGEGTAVKELRKQLMLVWWFENYFTKELGFSKQDLKDF